MSKTMQYAMDTAETSVDAILANVKTNKLSMEDAEKKILNVNNVALLGIDETNVGDMLYEEMNTNEKNKI